MKTQHNQPTKLRTPLFSCGFFRHCTQTVLSPTSTTTPPPTLLPSHTTPPSSKSLPDPPPPQPPQSAIPRPRPSPPSPPRPPPRHDSTSSSSSSASTSQSFTQWRIPTTPHPPPSPPDNNASQITIPSPSSFEELFHIAELKFSTGTQPDFISALHLLDRCLVPNPTNPTSNSTTHPICPLSVMTSLLMSLKNPTTSKPATKVLLALCLHEANRRVAVDAGAVTEVVESLSGLSGAPAERALAVLELMCTVEEGAVELRENALSVPMMVEVMKRMEGRGREYAISVLSVIFCNGGTGGGGVDMPPPEEVAKAVALALKGECSERGRRKGNQILNAISESGRSDVDHVANDQ